MGQQQLLLIILGVIVVGIAVAVGISQFGGNSALANRDGVTSSLINLAANAYQYRIRPLTLGGGGNSYVNYTIPTKMAADDNGTYSVSTAGSQTAITLQGVSTMNGTWSATCAVDSTGTTSVTYNGW